MGISVQHEGGYVLTASGSLDFGEITPQIAREIGRQAGKIRLRIDNRTMIMAITVKNT